MIAFDQTKPLLKTLASAGVDTKKLYFVDGNTSDYSSELDAGLLWKARKAPFLASTRLTISSSVSNPPVWI